MLAGLRDIGVFALGVLSFLVKSADRMESDRIICNFLSGCSPISFVPNQFVYVIIVAILTCQAFVFQFMQFLNFISPHLVASS